jgi:hypothetical protein
LAQVVCQIVKAVKREGAFKLRRRVTLIHHRSPLLTACRKPAMRQMPCHRHLSR